MLAVPDRLIDDQEGGGTAIAMACRHIAVEGLGALLKPVFGRGEEGDVVVGRAHYVALIVRREAELAQHGADFRIVPEFLGEYARHAVGIGRRTHPFLELGKAVLLLAENPAPEHRHHALCQVDRGSIWRRA